MHLACWMPHPDFFPGAKYARQVLGTHSGKETLTAIIFFIEKRHTKQ